MGQNAGEPNNLLRFMQEVAKNARHVLLGTATPTQTHVEELWDLLDVLGRGAEQVMGRAGSLWRAPEQVLRILTGQQAVTDEAEAWELLRNPLPPKREDPLFDFIRADIHVADNSAFTSRPHTDLEDLTREMLRAQLTTSEAGLPFFQRSNPVLRHTVLRRRARLEEQGLLPRIAVDIHPDRQNQKPFFNGLGLLTNDTIDAAYRDAVRFTEHLRQRRQGAGFLKNLLLQRICSSLASGLATARRLLNRQGLDEDGHDDTLLPSLTDAERSLLQGIIESLSSSAVDPKFEAVCHYLLEGPGWLAKGCIIFSQYYDTAYWVAESLARRVPQEPIALYAGVDRSGLFREGQWVSVDRDAIKRAVRERHIRLVAATDAACEGLNLQTLGTLINVDLPWNPSRLEQRLGRIKRIGQSRTRVDMLNLVYHGTRDEDVYARLSERMKDRYDIFGSLPDVIEDDWIEDIENLDRKLAEFIERRRRVTAFELRYGDTVEPQGEPWERCARVLSRRDIMEHLSRSW